MHSENRTLSIAEGLIKSQPDQDEHQNKGRERHRCSEKMIYGGNAEHREPKDYPSYPIRGF